MLLGRPSVVHPAPTPLTLFRIGVAAHTKPQDPALRPPVPRPSTGWRSGRRSRIGTWASRTSRRSSGCAAAWLPYHTHQPRHPRADRAPPDGPTARPRTVQGGNGEGSERGQPTWGWGCAAVSSVPPRLHRPNPHVLPHAPHPRAGTAVARHPFAESVGAGHARCEREVVLWNSEALVC